MSMIKHFLIAILAGVFNVPLAYSAPEVGHAEVNIPSTLSAEELDPVNFKSILPIGGSTCEMMPGGWFSNLDQCNNLEKSGDPGRLLIKGAPFQRVRVTVTKAITVGFEFNPQLVAPPKGSERHNSAIVRLDAQGEAIVEVIGRLFYSGGVIGNRSIPYQIDVTSAD